MTMLARERAHLCIGIKAAIVMWLSVDAARMAAVMSASDFCENICCSTSCMSITDTMLCTPSGCASPACKGMYSLAKAHLEQRVIMLSCHADADYDNFDMFQTMWSTPDWHMSLQNPEQHDTSLHKASCLAFTACKFVGHLLRA